MSTTAWWLSAKGDGYVFSPADRRAIQTTQRGSGYSPIDNRDERAQS